MDNNIETTAPNFRTANCCIVCKHSEDNSIYSDQWSGECRKYTQILFLKDGPIETRLMIDASDICDDFEKAGV